MFAFGSQTDDGFVFVQANGHVYTFPTEREARKSFPGVKSHAHLYHVALDLKTAHLIEIGDNPPAPEAVETTEEQRLALYESYPYKSLLCWCPLE